MLASIAFILSSFCFGYCVSDIILKNRASKRLDQILKELEEKTNK
jgi:hypothetical protein